MTVDIDTLYEMLDERKPIEVQEDAIREARKIKSLSVFMQPVEYKWSWENCAKVICEKTDKELIVIGKALKLSPPFPPPHTGRATFIAPGVPSN